MKTLIKDAILVLPTETRLGSILVDDSKIAAIDPPEAVSADQVIDASGYHLLPGVVDDQVHFREPGLTHKEDLIHATRACAKGGVTSFLEMPNTNPTTTTVERLEEKLEMAAGKCLVNYGFYVGATAENVEQLQRAARTPGIKIFIGSSTGDLLVDEQAALERIFAETDLPICAHCEDETTIRQNAQRFAGATTIETHSKIRDHQAALVSTQRAIELSKRYHHRFHVLHVSTAQEIPLIAGAEGIVTAEVCPHHLFFNIDDYPRLGSRIKMNPSVKTREDNEALWNALVEGVIQVVATDHAPHTLDEKALPYPECPSGLPAIENSLALMLDQVGRGKVSLETLVQRMCEAPARVWDMVGKGQIAVGADADLVLVDMDLTQTVLDEEQQTKTKWSPWHGMSLTGWPIKTWVMGQLVFEKKADGSEWFASDPLGAEICFDRSQGGYWEQARVTSRTN